MEIVISHKSIKRHVRGAYAICGSREALLWLAHHIIDAVGDSEDSRFSYGWIDVPDPVEKSTNTPPKEWDEK